MNMRLFAQSAPPLYLTHIVTWSALPSKRLAQPPEAVEHIPANIRHYIATEPGSVRLNIPLTATRHYLRDAEFGLQNLLKSLRINPKAWGISAKTPDALERLFEQLQLQKDFLWIQTSVGQKIVDDLVQFHRNHAEALGFFGGWMQARSRTGRGEQGGDLDPLEGRPEELPGSIERLQRHILSRIALARKALECSVCKCGDDKTKVLMAEGIAKVIAAFADEGLRTEFDAMPLELSIQRYLLP